MKGTSKPKAKGKWPIEGLSRFLMGLQRDSPGTFEVSFRLKEDGQVEDFHLVRCRDAEDDQCATVKCSGTDMPRSQMASLTK